MSGPDRLTLLHLSDLHFGRFSRFPKAGLDELARRLARSIEEVRTHQTSGSTVDLLIVTGDLAEAAMPKEYRLANGFFSALSEALRLPRDRFVFLPGNHDVSWTACRQVEERDDYAESELRRQLDAAKLTNFWCFVDEFNGRGSQRWRPLAADGREYRFDDLEVSVAALNTCERESHRKADQRGALGHGQAQALMDAWSAPALERYVKIIALHHNPSTVGDPDLKAWSEQMRAVVEREELTNDDLMRYGADLLGLEGSELVKNIVRDRHPQLLLHGHIHAADEKSLPWGRMGSAHLLSAGSWGMQLPREQSNSLRLIELDLRNERLHAFTLIYDHRARLEGNVSSGQWLLDPAQRDGYEQRLDLPPARRPLAAPRSVPDEALIAALGTPSNRSVWMTTSDHLGTQVVALANDLEATGRSGFALIDEADAALIAHLGLRDVSPSDLSTEVERRLREDAAIFPIPALRCERVSHGSVRRLVVRVEPYAVPPVVKLGERAFVREGTSTRLATPADQGRLNARRPLSQMPFDLRPMEGATLDDLDLSQLRPRFEATRTAMGFEDWLTSQELGRVVAGRWTPNAGALLLYGLSPATFVRGAQCEFVRYSGVDVDQVSHRKTIPGSVPEQLKTLWELLRANLSLQPGSNEGATTEYVPPYPLEALREFARNLLQHRDYEHSNAPSRVEWFEDRIVFSNPGGLYGVAAADVFGEQSDYRNPIVTRGLKELSYVEQLGRGIRLARRLLKENSNPELETHVDGFTRLIVWRRP